MKRHKVRAIIGVVVLLLAATLLTGSVSPPFAEVEVPLFIVTPWMVLVFFGVVIAVVIGLGFLIAWLVRWLSHRF